jgi:acetyl-CoA carboxylase biotin carboxyl carrier protein
MSELDPAGTPDGAELLAATGRALIDNWPGAPRVMRIRAADVTVELEWGTVAASPGMPAPGPAVSMHGAGGANGANGNGSTGTEVAPAPADERHYVVAPTVGVFYRSPEPGSPPFVDVGDLVEPGQQVGIVEAMKLMIPVEAECAGRIVEIICADAQAVEFEQRLICVGAAI